MTDCTVKGTESEIWPDKTYINGRQENRKKGETSTYTICYIRNDKGMIKIRTEAECVRSEDFKVKRKLSCQRN